MSCRKQLEPEHLLSELAGVDLTDRDWSLGRSGIDRTMTPEALPTPFGFQNTLRAGTSRAPL